MATILFLELEQDISWAVASIGPAFIASYLRSHGHEVRLISVPVDMSAEELLPEIQRYAPDLLGVSLASRQWLRAVELIPPLRKVLDIPVIAGGLHASFAAEDILDTPGFDYVCVGEGEQATLELVEALDHGGFPDAGIANIRIKDRPAAPLRPPFEPIDALPFMARDMLGEKHGVRNIVTQRGCPYRCTYCAARQFSDLYEGSYASYGRRRSPENVMQEILALRDMGELNYIVFLDDTFTINHTWIKEFCKLYGESVGLPFSVHARAETITETLISHLAAAGCRHMVYGVESGSDRVRRDILQRCVSNRRLIESFRMTREAGMLATANYILGTPGETRADIDETLALHDQLKPDDFGYFVFYPYPGTSLYKLCKERGYLPENPLDFPAHHHATVLNMPDLSAADIEEYYMRFTELRIRDRIAQLPADIDTHTRQTMIDQIRQNAVDN